jgi:hypothetical protein
MSTNANKPSDRGRVGPANVGGSNSWPRRPFFWLLIFGVVAIVLIEGFALSWGNSSFKTGNRDTKHAITTIAQPNIRLCPKSKVQLIEVDYLRYPIQQGMATVIGHAVTIVCGGLDDSHFIVHSTPVKVNLRKDAKIVLMELKLSPKFYVGDLGDLNDYLSHDVDGNVFIVTGPDSGATGLFAVFHP